MTDELRAKIAERFPSALWLLDQPEVAALLEEAANAEWSPELFQSKLQATNWWRSQTDLQRQRQAAEATNPGQTTADVNALKEQIKAMGSQLGATIADERAGALAWVYYRGGFTTQQIRQAVTAEAAPGTLSAGTIDVGKLADRYMVTLSQGQIDDFNKRLFTGALDANSLEGFIAQMATQRYPQLGDWIKKGIAPGDYFAPYKNMIGQLTDTPPEQIDLTRDPTWQAIISKVDDKTKELRPMTLQEATRYVRGTSQFADSRTGQAEQADFVTRLEAMLGTRA